MSKYIDTELLRKEIEKNKNMIDGLFTEGDDSVYDGENDAYNRVFRIIDSLQQERPNCHTVEDWIQHIKNADQLTKDIFSKGPYDVLYDALNHPYQHCYDAIKEFGELCFQTGMNSAKQEQPEVDLEKELNRYLRGEFQQTAGGNFNNYIQVASYFYELGLKARKEETKQQKEK